MIKITLIEHEEFGKLRVIFISKTPYFVANDIAKIWGHTNFTQCIRRYLSEDDFKKIQRSNKDHSEIIKAYCDFSGNIHRVNSIIILTYEGLKKMVLGIQKLYAKNEFIQWVAKEINIDATIQYFPVRKELTFDKILTPFCETLGHKIKKQHRVGSYRLDFYIPSKNIAIEFDENEHIYNKKEDHDREMAIKKMLGCEFIRVKESENYGHQLAYLSTLLTT